MQSSSVTGPSTAFQNPHAGTLPVSPSIPAVTQAPDTMQVKPMAPVTPAVPPGPTSLPGQVLSALKPAVSPDTRTSRPSGWEPQPLALGTFEMPPPSAYDRKYEGLTRPGDSATMKVAAELQAAGLGHVEHLVREYAGTGGAGYMSWVGDKKTGFLAPVHFTRLPEGPYQPSAEELQRKTLFFSPARDASGFMQGMVLAGRLADGKVMLASTMPVNSDLLSRNQVTRFYLADYGAFISICTRALSFRPEAMLCRAGDEFVTGRSEPRPDHGKDDTLLAMAQWNHAEWNAVPQMMKPLFPERSWARAIEDMRLQPRDTGLVLQVSSRQSVKAVRGGFALEESATYFKPMPLSVHLWSQSVHTPAHVESVRGCLDSTRVAGSDLETLQAIEAQYGGDGFLYTVTVDKRPFALPGPASGHDPATDDAPAGQEGGRPDRGCTVS